MPFFFPKHVVLNWYRYDVCFSVALMESFVRGIEDQAEESITRYEEKKETIILSYDDVDNDISTVEGYQGLNSDSWDLAKIFCKYFPSLQRQSALITVCSYFENELEKLCELYQKELGFVLQLSDLSGKGIERSTNYLEKVAHVDTNRTSAEWAEIKTIQKLRNILVHRHGKVHYQNDVCVDKDVRRLIEKTPSLDLDGDNVVIKKGFLADVLQTYNRFFKLLNISISAEQKIKSD